MSQYTAVDKELLDYYRHYCELAIWFKKIVSHSDHTHPIAIRDISKEFIEERNRILPFVTKEQRMAFKTDLNAIAMSYYNKVANWSEEQKISHDMV